MQTVGRTDADHRPAPTPDPWATLRPLAVSNFRAFWLATVPWNLGRWIEILVTGWLMFELTSSAWEVALLGFFRAAALPLVGVFAGVVADRLDRLNLVRAAQIVNITVPAAFGWLVLAGAIAPWHLYLGTLLMGLSWAFDFPTRRALMADILPDTQLVHGTVLDNLSMNGSKIIGPALGGVLLYAAGPVAGFAFLALAYASGAVLLLLVRRPALDRARASGSPMRNLVDGLTFVVRDRAVRGVLLITIIMNLLIFPHIQLLPVFARDIFGVGPVELGWLSAGNGIGALFGLGFISRRHGGRLGRVFLVGSAAMALTLAAFAGASWYALGLLLLVAGGIGHAGFGTMQSAILLSQTQPHLRGRALGALTLAIGSSPFGALIMGALADRLGAPAAVAICAGAALVAVALIALLLPDLRRASQAPA